MHYVDHHCWEMMRHAALTAVSSWNSLWQFRVDGVTMAAWLRIIARYAVPKGCFSRLRVEGGKQWEVQMFVKMFVCERAVVCVDCRGDEI